MKHLVSRASSGRRSSTASCAWSLILVVLQLWLLTATMNASWAATTSVVWPAALASLGLPGLNLGLLRYLYRDRSDGATAEPGELAGPAPGLLRAGDGDGHRLARRQRCWACRPSRSALFWLNVGLYVVLWVLYLARLVLASGRRSSPT